jgi:hypothetical protein
VTVVVNWGAGLVSQIIDFEEARAASSRAKKDLLVLFLDILRNQGSIGSCDCGSPLHVIGSH